MNYWLILLELQITPKLFPVNTVDGNDVLLICFLRKW